MNERLPYPEYVSLMPKGNAPEARAAIAALQGTTCRGRTLTVTEARQREERHGPRRPRG